MRYLEFSTFFLFNLIFTVKSYITYDSNILIIDSSITTNMACMNGKIYYQTQKFSDQFETIPQIFFTRQYFDQSFSTVDMTFKVKTITKVDFTIKLTCAKKQVYRMNLNWFATVDQRVEILDFFYSEQSGQYIEPHYNPMALKGFPSIISLSYSGAFTLDIIIDEITATEVKYTVTQTGSLLHFGFQIFLIVEEGFSFIDRLYEMSTYTSNIMTQKNNCWLIVSYVGFEYANTDWMREYITYTKTDTTIQYQIQNNGIKTPNTHYAVWIGYLFTKQFQPLFVTRINTVSYYDSETYISYKQVRIMELDRIFSIDGVAQFNSDTNLIIDSSVNILNIEVICLCNKQIYYGANFYTGEQQIKSITKICIPDQNKQIFRFRIIDTEKTNKEIDIFIYSSGVKIIQVIYNQQQTQVILFQLFELLNY